MVTFHTSEGTPTKERLEEVEGIAVSTAHSFLERIFTVGVVDLSLLRIA